MDAFIISINRDLAQLYNLGLELPSVELIKFYADTLELDAQVLDVALQNIKNNTPFQYYRTVLNPLELEMPSNGTGDFIDDLYDIYKDLKLGLTYFEEVEGYKEFALWTLKMTFQNHWSHHCISALQIIHEYLSNKD